MSDVQVLLKNLQDAMTDLGPRKLELDKASAAQQAANVAYADAVAKLSEAQRAMNDAIASATGQRNESVQVRVSS